GRAHASFDDSRGLLDALGVAKPKVFDVIDGLVEQVGNVGVVKGVDDGAAASFADYKTEVAEYAELLRHRRPFHRHRLGELADRAWSLAEAAEDADAARGRERLHSLCNLASGRQVELAAVCLALDSVRHDRTE